MSDQTVLRRSIRVRQDGWIYPSPWEEIIDIKNIVPNWNTNALFKVDGVEYHANSPEWHQKLTELQTWSKLCTTTK